jgi:lipopolysaccharide biosynthesis glycosyltransferase
LSNLQNYFEFTIDTSGWNPIVLARLLLDQLLPKDLDRILYLDGDTIVRNSLSNLWNTDMGDYAIGASVEPTCNKERKNKLGLSGKPYYNAGVLLVDLVNWRNNKTGEQILNFYKKNQGKLFANDQDAINGSQAGKIKTLSSTYNYCNTFYFYSYHFLRKLVDFEFMGKEEYRQINDNPTIVHYLGEERPWRIGNHHRFKKDYDDYLSLTPWSGQNYEDGWKLYFLIWDIFNFVMKPFQAVRYKIIDSLIPMVLKYRSKKRG